MMPARDHDHHDHDHTVGSSDYVPGYFEIMEIAVGELPAKLPFPPHVHMLRHSTGYALAGRGTDTRRLQHFLGHASITNTVRYTAMSPEPFKDIWRDN